MRQLCLLIVILCPWPLWASDICLALQAGDPSLGDPNATCQSSALLGGGAQTSCYWVYAYRAPEAEARLEGLRSGIEACLGAEAAQPEDTQVNHPDSFTLHRYEGQGIRVALSLKDKAGLGQSLIFLSLSAAQ